MCIRDRGKFNYTHNYTFMGFHCGNTNSKKLTSCNMKYQMIMARTLPEEVTQGTPVSYTHLEEAENDTAPHIYNHGLVTIGEKSVIPDGISVGKNSVISGVTAAADYEDSQLASGKTLIKAGE